MKVRSAHWIYLCLLMFGGKLLSCQAPAPTTPVTANTDFVKFTKNFKETNWLDLEANGVSELPGTPINITQARKYLCTDQSRCNLADGSNEKEYLGRGLVAVDDQYTLLIYSILEPPVDIITKLVCFDKISGRQTSSLSVLAEFPGERHFIESKFNSESHIAVEHTFEVPRQADQVDDKLNRVIITENFKLVDGHFELIDTQEKVEAID